MKIFLNQQQELADNKYKIDKDTSDGYHTFGELYHHRTILFASLVNLIAKDNPEKCFKSKQHDVNSDLPMFDDMFIAGIITDEGQVTYHQHLEYWDNFHCQELPNAPKFDGHTPDIAIQRLESEYANVSS